jgi:hypothetical protein
MKERGEVFVAKGVMGWKFTVETTVVGVNREDRTLTLRLNDARDELPDVGRAVAIQWAEADGETVNSEGGP